MYCNMRKVISLTRFSFFILAMLLAPPITWGREPVYFESDFLQEKAETFYARGQVKINHRELEMCSNFASYNRFSGDVNLHEEVKMTLPEGTLAADNAKYNLKTGEGEFTHYQGSLHDSRVRFYGESILVHPQQFLLSTVRLTSCPTKDEDWLISQNKAVVDRERQEITVHNALFYLEELPVMYLPYWRFYYGNAPKSGFLKPDINIKSDGIEGKLPYYFRLADNRDLTVIPHYDSEYGFELGNQFRFLAPRLSGEIQLNQVFFEPEARGWQYLQMQSNRPLSPWHWWVEAEAVSDDFYLQNFGDDHEQTTKRNLPRRFGVSYTQDIWQADINFESYKTLGDEWQSPAQILPQINYHYADDGIRHRVQYSRFKSASSEMVDRLLWGGQVEHRYDFPQFNIESAVGVETGYFSTDTTNEMLVIPHAQLGLNSMQLLEPSNKSVQSGQSASSKQDSNVLLWRLLYQYAPYKNQDNIPLSTTQALPSSLFNLYEWNRFLGGDRFGDINAMAYGVEYRSLKQGQETFFLALAQRYHFSETRVNLQGAKSKAGGSNVFMHSELNVNKQWQLNADAEYNTGSGETERFYFDLNWHPTNERIFKLGYLSEETENFILGIASPIAERTQASFYVDYSLNDKKASVIKAFLQIEDDCDCWQLNMGIESRIIAASDRDTSFKIGITFSGLTSLGRSYNSHFDSIE